MAQPKQEKKAPSLIIWTCSALYTLGLINIIYSFTGAYAGYGLLYSAINVLLIVLLFAALSGVWVMEKWGVLLFIFIIIFKLGMDIFKGAFRYWELFLLVPVIIFLISYKKMK